MGIKSQASETSALVTPRPDKISDVATVVSFLKMIMGAGGFAFPWAFAELGLAGGVIVVFSVAGLGCMTMSELLALKRHVEIQRGCGDASYSDVARATLGTWGSGIVVFMSVTASLGGMAAYLSYISTTLNLLFPALRAGLVIAVTGLVLLPLVWLQDFSILSKLAGFGTAAVLMGYAATLVYSVLTMSPNKHLQLFTPVSSSARGFGPIAFLLCIHFVSFPLMTASRAATVEGRFERLSAVSLCIAAFVNSLFGAVGFIYFGPHVSTIVLNDIHGTYWCINAVKLLVCIDLLCTYPFLFVAASHIVENLVLPPKEALQDSVTHLESADVEKAHNVAVTAESWRYAIRVSLLLCSMLGGYEGNFGGLVSLVGDVSLTTLAYVLPPIMTMTLFRAELTQARFAANLATLLVGILVGTLSSGFTVAELLGYSSK